jgi:hypothetical protein
MYLVFIDRGRSMRMIKNILFGVSFFCVCHESISGDKQGIEETKNIPFESFKVDDDSNISQCNTDEYGCQSGAKINNDYFFLDALYKEGNFQTIRDVPISYYDKKGSTLKEAISKLSIDWLQQQKDKKDVFSEDMTLK